MIATTIARQIKEDNPGCYLIWAIGTIYENILDGNPYVDQVMGIPIENRMEVKTEWFKFEQMARGLVRKGFIDQLYLTQAYPGNPEKFYGCLRASMFRAYGKMTVPITPVLRLNQKEVDRVTEFAERYSLGRYKNVILFEYAPESSQSFITEKEAFDLARTITTEVPDTCIIMSGKYRKKIDDTKIIDGSYLSLRETAELTKHCTLLLGTGSGITMVCQSDWAKPIPTIQMIHKHSAASLKWDHTYFGLPTNQIIEITKRNRNNIVFCIKAALHDFTFARTVWNEEVKPDLNLTRFHMYFDTAVIKRQYLDIIPAFMVVCKEYGLSWDLIRFFGTFPGSIATLIKRKVNGGN